VEKRLIESGCRVECMCDRKMGALDYGVDRRRDRGSFGVNVGHLIVTSGTFVASLLPTVRGGDELFPNYCWISC